MAVVNRHYLWLQPYRRKLDPAPDSPTGVEVDEGNALSIDANGDVDHLVTSDAAFAGFAAISATSGRHDASTSTTLLTDSSKSWTGSLYVGRIIQNITDGSSGVITANDEATITVANGLTGGTDDDFDITDDFQIKAEIYTEGIVELTVVGLVDASVDDPVYASGSNTFTLTPSTNLPIGRVIEVRDAATDIAYVYFRADGNSLLHKTAAGLYGIGTHNPARLLELRGSAATLRITDDDSPADSFVEVDDSAPGQSTFNKTAGTGGAALVLNAIPSDGSGNAEIRFFRTTNTSGTKTVDFLKGDGTNTTEARIGTDGADTFFQIGGGDFGIGMTAPQERLQVEDASAVSSSAEGNTGRLTRRTAHETHTLAAAPTSDTTTITIPSGARLLAVQFTVNATVVDSAGDDTWSAAFVTGSTTTLATAISPVINTKRNLMLPDEISTGVCEIRFTANGGNFSAGVIEIVAYYEQLTSLANV